MVCLFLFLCVTVVIGPQPDICICMADVNKRLEKEKALIALLLIYWLLLEEEEWLDETPSAFESYRRMEEAGLVDYFDDLAKGHTETFLDEIEIDQTNLRTEILEAVPFVRDSYVNNFANKLARSHETFRRKYNEQQQRMRSGDRSRIKDIVPQKEWQMKRDAITSVSDITGDIEVYGKDYLESRHGIEIHGVWNLDPWSNWCETCMSLSGTGQHIWSAQFPYGPPAHDNCRCHVAWTRIYENGDSDTPLVLPESTRYRQSTVYKPTSTTDPSTIYLPRSGISV